MKDSKANFTLTLPMHLVHTDLLKDGKCVKDDLKYANVFPDHLSQEKNVFIQNKRVVADLLLQLNPTALVPLRLRVQCPCPNNRRDYIGKGVTAVNTPQQTGIPELDRRPIVTRVTYVLRHEGFPDST